MENPEIEQAVLDLLREHGRLRHHLLVNYLTSRHTLRKQAVEKILFKLQEDKRLYCDCSHYYRLDNPFEGLPHKPPLQPLINEARIGFGERVW